MVKHTQTISRLLPTKCLSVFGHFVGLAKKNKTPSTSKVKQNRNATGERTIFLTWDSVMSIFMQKIALNKQKS